MNLLCLMPTYGRRWQMLENSLACFTSQGYPCASRGLLIYDDLGTLRRVVNLQTGISLMVTGRREPSISHKYEKMREVAGDWPDVFAVWDDDDIYLPHHLESVASAVSDGFEWCKPSRILSTYGCRPGETIEESAAGRFHGSIAVTRRLLERVGGWPLTTRADFDQQMIRRLTEAAPCGDTLDYGPISYVYRWQDSGGGHCSGLMRSPDNEDWYARYQPDSRELIDNLLPRYDGITSQILSARGFVR